MDDDGKPDWIDGLSDEAGRKFMEDAPSAVVAVLNEHGIPPGAVFRNWYDPVLRRVLQDRDVAFYRVSEFKGVSLPPQRQMEYAWVSPMAMLVTLVTVAFIVGLITVIVLWPMAMLYAVMGVVAISELAAGACMVYGLYYWIKKFLEEVYG